MYCPICDQKTINCDCTEAERRQFSEIEDLEAEVQRLRLTDKEVEAIKAAIRHYEDYDMDAGCWHAANTLRGLLDRTQTVEK